MAAATSHAAAFDELGPVFTADTGIPVQFVYASTGQLSQQIRNGAPFDVFAAADVSHLAPLVRENLTLNQPLAFASGRLVLVAGGDEDLPGAWDSNILDSSSGRIAIANPRHAPYGLAAQQILTELNLWSALQSKIVYGESVRQALHIVNAGNAKFGLVAESLVDIPSFSVVAVPEGLYSPVVHHVVALNRSDQPQNALAFIEFLEGAAGRDILNAYGFDTP